MKIYVLLVNYHGQINAYRKAFKKKEDAFSEIENYAFNRGYSEVRLVDTFHEKCTKVIYASRANPELGLVFDIIEIEVTE